MNIAIIEDQKDDRLWISEKLNAYMKRNCLEFTWSEFETAEQFLESFIPGSFDIIFMDIYMDKINGIDAARLIRKRDFDCRLIFITASAEYLLEGYSVNACHYLLKPVSDASFEQAMDFCRISPRYAVPYLDVISRGLSIHLNTAKILYINISHRIVYIHTFEKTIPVSGSFRSVTKPLLADRRFLLCIQGIMVNMDMITDQSDSLFRLRNGEQIPINLRNRRSVIRVWQTYVFENMNR